MTEQPAATTRELRNFGILFGIVGGVAAAWLAWRGNSTWIVPLVVGIFFGLAGFRMRRVLRPIYYLWMKLAFVLAWVNTRLLLGVFFYVILTPLALGLRLGRWDPLGRRFQQRASSYWVKRQREPYDRARAERLF